MGKLHIYLYRRLPDQPLQEFWLSLLRLRSTYNPWSSCNQINRIVKDKFQNISSSHNMVTLNLWFQFDDDFGAFTKNINFWFHKKLVLNLMKSLMNSATLKPFHVVRMIFSDVIFGRKFVMIIIKLLIRPASYWSKNRFFLSFPVKKVNNKKISSKNMVISSRNNVQEDMNKFLLYGIFKFENAFKFFCFLGSLFFANLLIGFEYTYYMIWWFGNFYE